MEMLSKEKLIRYYEMMVRIRKVEEKLMEVFSKGEIPGFIHVCIGQEAAPVAVCSHLKRSDYMASTHRGHGHALAKGIDLKLFMAEVFGKVNGLCRGRSGSMHIADRNLGILGANGIVGAGIPIATGAAFAAQYKKTDQVTACFFGDGATDEGTFHESLNLASLKKLPIIYVCENNSWAQFTPKEVRSPIGNVSDRAAAYNIMGVAMPNDFFKIHEEAAKAVKRAREGKGPSLIEVKSVRWHGHYVGDSQKYRTKEDIDAAMREDCIMNLESKMISDEILTKDNVKRIGEKIHAEIEEALNFARESPYPEESELQDGLYA